ncbi:MAG: HypC/HybG/HupF family hydrogenase formation chaperone [Gammaproteobacteria bacterium]|nr:HypC/HybG/HupF family hydrogenase formation chaperone [Gammaproteobacteria bacterium]
MCIGMPMQVQTIETGFAWVRNPENNELIRVETALLDKLHCDDWVLVFLNSAREILTTERANEILQTQQLIAQAMNGNYDKDNAEVDYTLPSQMDTDTLNKMLGI